MPDAPVLDRADVPVGREVVARGRMPIDGRLLGVVAAALPLVAVTLAARSIHWIADDQCTAAWIHENGMAGFVTGHYKTWSGRFACTVAIALLQLIGPLGAHLGAPLTTCTVLLGATLLARRVLPSSAGRSGAVALGGALTSALVALSANPGQSILWLTGGVTYLLPLGLALLALAVSPAPGSSRRPAAAVGAGVCAAVAAGCNETASLVFTLGVVGAVVLVPARWRRPLVPVLAGTLGGTVFMVVAPGNRVRRATRAATPLDDVPMQAIRSLATLARTVVTGPGLVVLCAAVAVGVLVGRRVPLGRRVGLGAVHAGVVIPLASEVAAFVGLRAPLPDRARLAPSVALVLGAALGAAYLAARRADQHVDAGARALPSSALLGGVALALAAASMVNLAPDVAAARRTGTAAARTERLLEGAQGDPVDVAVPGPFALWGLANVLPDPAVWPTSCLARYWDVRSVRLDETA